MSWCYVAVNSSSVSVSVYDSLNYVVGNSDIEEYIYDIFRLACTNLLYLMFVATVT